MAPPELARDAPVVDVLHPVEVGLGPRLRDDARGAALHRRERRLGERLHLHEPLRREHRLDDRLAALAAADGHDVLLAAALEAEAAQILLDQLARLLRSRPRSVSSAAGRSRSWS